MICFVFFKLTDTESELAELHNYVIIYVQQKLCLGNSVIAYQNNTTRNEMSWGPFY